MAAVDGVIEFTHPIPGMQITYARLTGATSTWLSKFGTKTHAVHVQADGANATTFAMDATTKVVTITGTNDDYVYITAYGYY